MNTLYFIAIAVNVMAFLVGNYAKWKTTFIADKAANSMADTEYNKVTLGSTILVYISLLAVVLLADSIVIGVLTSILLFVVIDPLLAAVILNGVRAAKRNNK